MYTAFSLHKFSILFFFHFEIIYIFHFANAVLNVYSCMYIQFKVLDTN